MPSSVVMNFSTVRHVQDAINNPHPYMLLFAKIENTNVVMNAIIIANIMPTDFFEYSVFSDKTL